MGVDNCLISADNQPAILKWEGVAKGVALIFDTSQLGGKALLRWDGVDRDTVDLYDSAGSSLHVTVAEEQGWLVDLFLKCTEIIALAFAFMLLSLVVSRVEWESPRPSKEDSKRMVELGREIVQAAKQEIVGHWITLGIIAVTGVVFRILYLNQPMRGDESYTFLHFALYPFGQIMSDYGLVNNHVLHTILMRCSFILFGADPWALRLPVFMVGSVVVPATYVMGRLLFNKWVGLLAAALMAFFPPNLLYSTNARGYAMLTLFFVLLTIVAALLLKNPNRWLWLCFTALTVMGFYTVPVFLFPFSIIWCWLFLQSLTESWHPQCRNRFLRNLVLFSMLAAVLTMALYVPLVARSGLDSVVSARPVRSISWAKLFSRLPHQVTDMWAFAHEQMPFWGSLLGAIGLFLGIAFHRKLSAYRVSLMAVCVVVAPILILIQRVAPPVRVLAFFVIPIYAITAPAGLFWLYSELVGGMSKRWTVLVWSGLAIGISVIMNVRIWQSEYIIKSSWTSHIPHAEEVVSFLKGYLTPRDNVYATDALSTLQYYFVVRGYDSPNWNWGDRDFDKEGRIVFLQPRDGDVPWLSPMLERPGICDPKCAEADWRKVTQFGDGDLSIYEYLK